MDCMIEVGVGVVVVGVVKGMVVDVVIGTVVCMVVVVKG